MPVTLHAGPLNAGKTTTFLDLLATTLPRQSGLCVVPDAFTAGQLRRRLLTRVRGTPAAIPAGAILPWGQFQRLLARPLRPVLSRQQMAMLIHRLLSPGAFPALTGADRSLDMARRLAAAIQSLKGSGLSPAAFGAILDRQGPFARELAVLFERYERERRALDLLDEGDLAGLALDRLRSDPAAALGGITTLLVDEFAPFAPGARALLGALAEALPAMQIHVSHPMPLRASPHAGISSRWIEEGLARIAKLSTKAIELPARRMQDPKARLLLARSPQQEARALLRALSRTAAAPGEESSCAIAARPGGTVAEWLAAEAESLGAIPRPQLAGRPLEAAFLHRVLSPEAVDRLPAAGHALAFTEALRQAADADAPARAWLAAYRNSAGAESMLAESIAARAALKDALDGLEATATLLELAELRREDFLAMLASSLAPRGAAMHRLEAVLPFTSIPLGTPPCAGFHRVLVPRMIEGEIPRAGVDDPLFGGCEDPLLRELFPPAQDRYAAEAYAFEALCAKCRGELVLLAPAIDDDGGETLLSPFADRFAEALEHPEIVSPIVAASDAGRRDPGALGERIDVERSRLSEAASSSSRHPQYAGRLTAATARELVRERYTVGEIAVTSLEGYARCPFLFFAQHLLGIEALEEEIPEIPPRDRGTMLHEILRRFYEAHRGDLAAARADPAAEKRLLASLRRIAGEVWQASVKTVARISPGLRARQQAAIELMARQVIETELDEARHLRAPLTPRACEWSFGRAQENALAVPVPHGEDAALRGRVDRVDADEADTTFLVLDYKTGSVKSVVSKIRDGRHLQLPLYVEAVKASLLPGALPLGGLLVDVQRASPEGSAEKTAAKSHGLVRKAFDGACYRVGRSHSKQGDEEFEALLETAMRAAGESIAAIRRGDFAPQPSSDCARCTYADCCRHHVEADGGAASGD